MRPGQAAPVFVAVLYPRINANGSFNEAGAGCPGIPSAPCSDRSRAVCFNEAGAGCPGIPRRSPRSGTAIICFNEAGAGCPGIRPEPWLRLEQQPDASMRPGQAAPVFVVEGSRVAGRLLLQ